jgi:hypothetical protein
LFGTPTFPAGDVTGALSPAGAPFVRLERSTVSASVSINFRVSPAWGPAIYFQSGSAIFRLPDRLDSQGGDRARLHGSDRSAWVDRGCCITTVDTVVVHETDPVGIASAVYAHLAGAPRAILVGGPSGRLQPAREIGVGDAHIDIFEFSHVGDRMRLVLHATPGRHGADVVPECAGVPEAVA